MRVAFPGLLARGEQTLVVFEQPGNVMRVIDLTLVTEIQINGEEPKGRVDHR